MASQRYRLLIENVTGGVPTESSVTYAQTAGATADNMDLFLDNTDIKSEAHLASCLEALKQAVLRRYRSDVGGVSS